jgi:ADP-ribose pyrophosphatase
MPQRFEYDELAYDGRLMKVHRVGVRMPDGRVVPRELALYAGAVVVLPVLADGSMVLIRNYRFAVEETLWELPAGAIDPGESPADAARRELLEETGYRAGTLTKLGQFFTGPGSCNEQMHAFLAGDLTAGAQALEPYEQIQVQVLGEVGVRAMVEDGRIHDGKTIAALGLYWLRR